MVGISVHQLFSGFTGDAVATASECTNTEDKLLVEGTERGMVAAEAAGGEAEVVQFRWINMRQLGPNRHRKNAELAAKTSCINVFLDYLKRWTWTRHR